VPVQLFDERLRKGVTTILFVRLGQVMRKGNDQPGNRTEMLGRSDLNEAALSTIEQRLNPLMGDARKSLGKIINTDA